MIADRIGRRARWPPGRGDRGVQRLRAAAAGRPIGQDVFILVGFVLLGLSFGQAAGAVTSNFGQRYRYTGAALTSDLAWLIGAGFAPLVALGLSAHFGLASLGVYLLSGAVCTVVALRVNRWYQKRHAPDRVPLENDR